MLICPLFHFDFISYSLLVQRLERHHANDTCAAEHRLDRVLELDFDGSISEFQDLFQHLHAAYHELDAVFAANGPATMAVPTKDVHVCEGVSTRYFEVFANKLLPFSVLDSYEAAWDHFKGVGKHCGNGGLYEKAAKVQGTTGTSHKPLVSF